MKNSYFTDRGVLVTCALLIIGIILSIISIFIGTTKIALASITLVAVSFFTTLKLTADIFKKLDNVSRSIANGTIPEIAEKLQKVETVKHLQLIHFKYLEVIDFIQSLDKGEFKFNYIDPNNKTGILLTGILERQKQYAEEERRRSWVNEGIAQFSDILRVDKQSVEEASVKILTHLIKYVGANQGGFFIAAENDGKRTLELTACFAYNRTKFLNKTIEEGDGLLGQAMLEKNLIHRTEIPDRYTTITSGLGEATPTNLLVVPLVIEDNFCGAIELASFKVFEQYKIDFIQKVAESIASTIVTVKASENAQILLNKSHLMAEELKTQEEELKQNMVQLETTHQQMEKHQAELNSLFKAIESHSGLAEFDTTGNIIRINEWLIDRLGFDNEDLAPCNNQLIDNTEKEEICDLLKQGKCVEKEIQVLSKFHEQVWLNIHYSPVFDKDQNFKRVLILCQDISLRKKQELEIKSHLETLNKTLISLEFTTNGKITSVNEVFLNITNYKPSDILGKNYTDLLPEDETKKPQNQLMWQSLKSGNYFNGQFRQKDKNGKSIWLSGTLNPITNNEGTIIKIMMFAQLITQEKVRMEDMIQTINAFKSSTPFLELSPDYKVKSANKELLETLEYSRTEVRNKSIHLLIKNTNNILETIIDDHENLSTQWNLVFVTKSDKEIKRRVTFNKIKNADNEITKILGVFESDTELT
ncbi:PAS domain-containing protein [Fulvivirga sp. 29W222]|uniref:PAS domain-containing protein n=1 Tax=Fulvivirga marina TaxID=2494733 RepID=A0A937KBM2_9BACT|nr:PAS domain-containing protein [Fulvivirga marina]MBL6447106.1 PAS domain-containing protein [Fulvivirga marina]